MKIHPAEAELFDAATETDRTTKRHETNSRFAVFRKSLRTTKVATYYALFYSFLLLFFQYILSLLQRKRSFGAKSSSYGIPDGESGVGGD
jgi:hypothetical protein